MLGAIDQITKYCAYKGFEAKSRDKVDTEESKTSQIIAGVKNFFITCHNENWAHTNDISTTKPLTVLVLSNFNTTLPKSVEKFFAHQDSISKDPFSYAKGEQNHSLMKRAFDLTLGGSLPGIADTISSVAICITSFVTGLMNLVRGACGDKECIENAQRDFQNSSSAILSTVRCALRIVPVVGPFLGYGFSILSHAAVIGIGNGYNSISSMITSQDTLKK